MSPLRRTTRRKLLIGLVVPLVLGACGSSRLDEVARFDGDWVVAELVTNGQAIELGETTIRLTIETSEAAVSGTTGCHQIFGSYTLVDTDAEGPTSGVAGFTMPGVSTNECEAADLETERALLETMEAIVEWRQDGPNLEFTRPSDPPADRNLLVLRPAG